MSRVKNSFYNVAAGFLGQFISLAFSFVTRTVFIYTLGNGYLGLNGLFTEVLSVLSLAELGFGTAIVYSMYKPLAQGDEDKVSSILAFYKKIYRIVGMVILFVGLLLIPFLRYLIKLDIEVPINYIVIYVLFLLESVSSYLFFAYKSSLLTADQKNYIAKKYDYICSGVFAVIEVVILCVTHNYYIYLVARIMRNITYNLVVSAIVNKRYSYINNRNSNDLSHEEKTSIYKNVYALSISKVSGTVLNSTDNLVISSVLGISFVGLYSNYSYITTIIATSVGLVFSQIIASIGNLFAESTLEHRRLVFGRLKFVNFFLVSFATVCLTILINPFIELWIGKEYLLHDFDLYIIMGAFFVRQMENCVFSFRVGSGAFQEKKYVPLLSAFVNLVVSIILVNVLGLSGVFLGTIISRLTTTFLVDPVIVHRKILKVSCLKYYIEWMITALYTLLLIVLLTFIKQFILSGFSALSSLIILFLVTPSISLLLLYLPNCKNSNMMYYSNLIKRTLIKAKNS